MTTNNIIHTVTFSKMMDTRTEYRLMSDGTEYIIDNGVMWTVDSWMPNGSEFDKIEAARVAYQATKPVVFTTTLENDEGNEVLYHITADGTDYVNIWTAGDNTNSNGVNVTVDAYVDNSPHKAHLVELARAEYAIKIGAECVACIQQDLTGNTFCQDCSNDIDECRYEGYGEGGKAYKQFAKAGEAASNELNPSDTATVVASLSSGFSITSQEAVGCSVASTIIELCTECGRQYCACELPLKLLETEVMSSKGHHKYTVKLWFDLAGNERLSSCNCKAGQYRKAGDKDCRHVVEARQLWADKQQQENRKVAA